MTANRTEPLKQVKKLCRYIGKPDYVKRVFCYVGRFGRLEAPDGWEILSPAEERDWKLRKAIHTRRGDSRGQRILPGIKE